MYMIETIRKRRSVREFSERLPDEMARYLILADSLEIMAVIAMGYPAGDIEDGQRKPLAELLLEQ